MSTALRPYLFRPVYKDYLWGGSRIASALGRADTPEPCAESWEVSAHPDGLSIVEDGPEAGMSLADLCEKYGKGLLGGRVVGRQFPLLIKVIDASKRLSVQVHPSEETASQCGGEPKTEMWYFLDAREDAFVCAGLKPGVGPRIFRDAIREKRVPSLLEAVPVSTGKAIFIPGGLVHAICEGCFVLEVQQSSNTTYRVYDWDRVGADGKPRELHLNQAEKAIQWKLPASEALTPYPMPAAAPGNVRERVVRSDFFTMERYTLQAPEPATASGACFRVIFVLEGAVRIRDAGGETVVPFGRSCLIPAALGAYTLEPVDRACRFLTAEV